MVDCGHLENEKKQYLRNRKLFRTSTILLVNLYIFLHYSDNIAVIT